MARRVHHSAMLVLVVGCALLMLSCSFDRDSYRAAHQTSSEGLYKPANIKVIGKVPVDEFNDEATGKEVPAKGGQIVVRFNSEPQTMNNWLANADAYSQYIGSNVVETLLRRDDESLEWKGNLAERWTEEDMLIKTDGARLRGHGSEPEGEGKGEVLFATWDGQLLRVPRASVKELRRGSAFTFYLRKDVRFHDGSPMTAEDVKFTFDTILNENVDAPDQRSYLVDVENYEIVDRYTFRVVYSKQYWYARNVLGGQEVIPKKLYDGDNLQERDPKAFGKRFNESEHNRKPVGTGPYKFERWDTGQQIVLMRNDDYWDKSRAGHLDRIIYRFITDDVAALQALKNGEIDFNTRRIKPESFDGEMNSPAMKARFVKVAYDIGGFLWTGWNIRRPPFDDVRVRQAMNYAALNKPEFIHNWMHDRGVIVTGPESYLGPEYDHSVPVEPYDPEKAKQLLLEAGWYDRDGDGLRDKNGQPFRFEFLIPCCDDIYTSRAALMKENLRQLGIDMTVRQLEWATFIQNVNDYAFDACSLRWANNVDGDPFQLWHSSQAVNRGSNYVGLVDAEVDRLLVAARLELDDQKRQQIYFQFHRRIAYLQPYHFLWMEPELGAYNKKYRGVKFYHTRPGYNLAEWFIPQDKSS
jgi:peptide/nickel transport system substrate-binding protein